MDANKELYRIHLHYQLSQEGVHVMNAKVHNECEHNFLRALESLKQYVGDFEIKVAIPNEGGFIDEFIINIVDPNLLDLIRGIIIAFVTYFFTNGSTSPELLPLL